MEPSHSGLVHHLGKVAGSKGSREFKSLRFRPSHHQKDKNRKMEKNTIMLFTAFITILGLSLFEAVSSVDNAIINAEVLQTMGARARKWFLTWGMFIAVFLVRGALPFLIIWAFNTSLTPIQILSAAWSNDPLVLESIEKSAPILLVAGGVFLL